MFFRRASENVSRTQREFASAFFRAPAGEAQQDGRGGREVHLPPGDLRGGDEARGGAPAAVPLHEAAVRPDDRALDDAVLLLNSGETQ